MGLWECCLGLRTPDGRFGHGSIQTDVGVLQVCVVIIAMLIPGLEVTVCGVCSHLKWEIIFFLLYWSGNEAVCDSYQSTVSSQNL